MGLALVGAGLIAVDQHHVDPGACRDIADARTHEAGADDGELLYLGRRHVLRAARTLVQFLHRQEQAADHRRRFLPLQDMREVARLDAQAVVDVDQQPLIDAAHDGARGRIVVVSLAAVDRVRRREHVHAGCGIDRAARQLEALDVPRLNRLAAGLDPVLRGLDEVGGRHHRADDVRGLGLVELDLVALEQQWQRVLRRHHARQTLRAAAARKQTDFDFGQAEPGLGIVRCHAIVAGQRQFEGTAKREPVDRGDPRLAAGLQLAERLRELAALVEQHLRRGLLAFCLGRLGEQLVHAFEHGEIGAGRKRLLAGGDDNALHPCVGGRLIDDGVEFLDGLGVQHVHRLAGNIPRDERNAVGVGFDFEILEGHVLAPILTINFCCHCEERSDEAIQTLSWLPDCFASLAMTRRGLCLLTPAR